MTAEERAALIELLETTLTQLEASVAAAPALSPATGWTVGQILEHLALIEVELLGGVQKALEFPATPEALAFAQGRDGLILRGVRSRARLAQTPEPFLPTGRYATAAEALAALRAARAVTLEFVRTTEADLRAHTFPHFILREMDAYQWLLFIAAHTDRHAEQIRLLAS